MKLIFTYDDKESGELALNKIIGEKRLASERDDTTTVYNLFGTPTWGNFYRLGLFDLVEFEKILKAKATEEIYSEERYNRIFTTIEYVAKQHNLEIPPHWR